jgi:membrane-bound lytic murein transglycosylase B
VTGDLLTALTVQAAAVTAAEAEVARLSSELADWEAEVAVTKAWLRDAETDAAEEQEAVTAAGEVRSDAVAVLVEAETAFSDVIVGSYMAGGSPVVGLSDVLEAQNPAVVEQRRTVVSAVAAGHSAIVADAVRLRGEADATVRSLTAQLVEADRAVVKAASRSRLAVERRNEIRVQLEEADGKVSQERAALVELQRQAAAVTPTSPVPGTDLPFLAADAYVEAADWARGTFPGCRLQWWALAGVGRHESNHGRFAGSVITPTGAVSPPIIGIALDGTRSLAIPDSDGGRLDGDVVWDRAVGPTQFIPQTWAFYAVSFDLDGNGDGVEDPQNMYDAARATSSLLCRNGWKMAEQAQRAALWSYNPSQRYNDLVFATTAGYRTVVLPDLTYVGPIGAAGTSLPVGDVDSEVDDGPGTAAPAS